MSAAFIVEGRAEQKIVQKLCPSAKVMILECNGDDVALKAIAKKVSALVKVCGNRHHPIIIELDREKRAKSIADITRELGTLLEQMGHNADQFRICVADRDLESWILYAVDEYGVFSSDCSASLDGEFEGESGEWVLKKRLKLQNEQYHKTTTGVDLFTKISARALSIRSPSFHALASQLQDCWWLGK